MSVINSTRAENIEILIVEDSLTQAEKLRYFIEKKGYRVSVASNGKVAIAAIEESKPDLVISDVVMPEMNGYQLCQTIKSHSAWSDITVILMTSLNDSEDVLNGLKCGADNFIRKPYDENYLATRIEYLLMARHLRKNSSIEVGVAVCLDGKRHFINSERQQILDLLISTYEQAVLVNNELSLREKKIIDLNSSLEMRAVELEVANRELDLKNIELKAANKAKTTFLSSMSHELRTPLNAIIGFSEMLKDGQLGDLTEEQRKYMGYVFDSGEHLLSLINDILDLSKIEAGKMTLDLELLDISGLLKDSISIVNNKAADNHIILKTDLTDDVDTILVDIRKVKQIIYNLLSNAIKFTQQGGTITLRMRRVPRSEVGKLTGRWPMRNFPLVSNEFVEFLEMSVADTGIGIPHDSLEKLFQRFSQVNGELARKFEGTGLGLALLKQLVELHGGTVAVESAENQGSVFLVWLPLDRAFPCH